MSRSKPNENAPNPATRWFEWNGEKGLVRYYDKEQKKNVDVGADFTFLLLDQLGSIGGWHDASDSSIYSNAVRDVRAEVLVVKSHKEGVLAEGLYKDIKDRVNACGGYYEAQCYIAYKREDGSMSIGCLRFKGAALHAWAEFVKSHRADVYERAVRINGFTEGQKGRVIYRVPVLSLVPVSTTTHHQAVTLDTKLQAWLDAYLNRTKSEQAEQSHPEAQPEPELAGVGAGPAPITDDDIPF